MRTADFQREQDLCRASGRLTPKFIEATTGYVEAAHPGNQTIGPQFRDLLIEHAGKKPGRRPDPEKQQRIAQAAIQAKFNRSIGEEVAAKQAAAFYKVPWKSVFRAAFERKDKPMRDLIREARKNSTGL